jgi:hypothetical protein
MNAVDKKKGDELVDIITAIVDEKIPSTKEQAEYIIRELSKEIDKLVAEKVRVYLSKMLDAASSKVEKKEKKEKKDIDTPQESNSAIGENS